jgi:hypothetical protein
MLMGFFMIFMGRLAFERTAQVKEQSGLRGKASGKRLPPGR